MGVKFTGKIRAIEAASNIYFDVGNLNYMLKYIKDSFPHAIITVRLDVEKWE